MTQKLRDELLTADEEKTLARLAAKGNIKARDRMILSNERLVWKIASRYGSCMVDVDDLVQEGLIGLCDAVIFSN
jgi:DNA-directed RNA polymerase sigma subunit (sigma70/sigma32)